MKAPVYLDYNATTPIDPVVADAMRPYLNDYFGNPSSSHIFGVESKKAIEKARGQVADLIECSIDEIIFTSGGSESNNLAIKGIAFANRSSGNHIITSSVEHPAVYEVCQFLEKLGFNVTYLPVDQYGMVDPDSVKKAITRQTILITVMHANNEVGTIQPIKDISAISDSHGIAFHSDCAQSIGKIEVKISQLNLGLLSIAGHKFYAPKGIGALYVQSGLKLEKLIHGAAHELNRRAGTENVLEIVGLGKASELIREKLDVYHENMKITRDRLEEGLLTHFPEIRVNGHPQERLPNTLSVSFRGIEAGTIISELVNVAASAGAACHSDNIDISTTLKAMNVPIEDAMGTIRFSTGRNTTTDEIDFAVEQITEVVKKLLPGFGSIPVTGNNEKVKLTRYTHGLGCACKMRPQLLEGILKKMPLPVDENIIVGLETSDDAAVYKIDENTAIVQTVDFFTPVVDDPFDFGAIAAVNSLSDIYAMGGDPLFALNIAGFPSSRLPAEVLHEIFNGALFIAGKAGISVIGGHTIDDTEPKFGWVVTGIIHPDKVIRNCTAEIDDVLILTKPIGTGILSTALKQNLLSNESINELKKIMLELNKGASDAMIKVGVNSCTDITGFGLLGHLLEMTKASGVSAAIYSSKVPLIKKVNELAASGVLPGGTKNNYEYTLPHIYYDEKISDIRKYILNDAQTSGGLLISVPKIKEKQLLLELKNSGIKYAVVIGKVIRAEDHKIFIEE